MTTPIPCMRCGSLFDTWQCVFSEMTYIVSGGALNSTHSGWANVPPAWRLMSPRSIDYTNLYKLTTAGSPHLAVSINVPRDVGMQVRPWCIIRHPLASLQNTVNSLHHMQVIRKRGSSHYHVGWKFTPPNRLRSHEKIFYNLGVK